MHNNCPLTMREKTDVRPKRSYQKGQPHLHIQVLLVFSPPPPICDGTNNILTLDRAVLVATFMVGLEIDFAKLFISVIHERSFNTSTTYPFSCIILDLYRYARVPIWHRDSLRTSVGTVDIGSSGIRPMGWHRGEELLLSENLANTIEFSQRDDPDTSENTNTTPKG